MRKGMRSVLQLAADLGVEPVDRPRARVGDERDVARLPRLEPHRRPGRDVEPHAARLATVELQRLVGLEEVVVRADLDRPLAGVGDLERDGRAALVEEDVALRGDDLAGDHRIGSWTVTSLVPSGNVASTWISWIISGMPSMTCSRRRISAPSRMSWATLMPSRAPSTTWSEISATA